MVSWRNLPCSWTGWRLKDPLQRMMHQSKPQEATWLPLLKPVPLCATRPPWLFSPLLHAPAHAVAFRSQGPPSADAPLPPGPLQHVALPLHVPISHAPQLPSPLQRASLLTRAPVFLAPPRHALQQRALPPVL